MMNKTIRADPAVSMKHTTNSTHPQIIVLQMVDFYTDLSPFEPALTAVILDSGSSIM
jgi:hypothetical protein